LRSEAELTNPQLLYHQTPQYTTHTTQQQQHSMSEELHDLEAGTSASSSDFEEEQEGISPAYNDEKLKDEKKKKKMKKGHDESEGDDDGSDDEVDGSSESRDDLQQSDAGLRSGATSSSAKTIPVTLAFKNLFFSVKVRKGKNPLRKKHKKALLKDLHGELRPGEVTAIMGPSGTVPSLSLHSSSLYA
jgi:ABC-type glutathione transport system ATPase component